MWWWLFNEGIGEKAREKELEENEGYGGGGWFGRYEIERLALEQKYLVCPLCGRNIYERLDDGGDRCIVKCSEEQYHCWDCLRDHLAVDLITRNEWERIESKLYAEWKKDLEVYRHGLKCIECGGKLMLDFHEKNDEIRRFQPTKCYECDRKHSLEEIEWQTYGYTSKLPELCELTCLCCGGKLTESLDIPYGSSKVFICEECEITHSLPQCYSIMRQKGKPDNKPCQCKERREQQYRFEYECDCGCGYDNNDNDEEISEIWKEINKKWAATWKVIRKNLIPSQGFEDEWEEYKWEEDMKERETWEMDIWMKEIEYDQLISLIEEGNIATAMNLLKESTYVSEEIKEEDSGKAVTSKKKERKKKRVEKAEKRQVTFGKLIDDLEDADNDSKVRAYAAKALGIFGDKRAIGSLIEALQSTHFEIRGSSIQALRKLSGQEFECDYKKWKAWQYDDLKRLS